MMWLICGPSSVGKSTFIESGKAAQVANLPNNTETKFPIEFDSNQFASDSDFFLHYNILRPYHFIDDLIGNSFVERLKRMYFLRCRGGIEWKYMRKFWSYENDTSWLNILNTKCEKKAIILICTKNNIIERTKQRLIIEKLDLTQTNIGEYPVSFWLDLYERIDLNEVYRIWCQELEQRGIDYICIDSSDSSYNVIDKQSLSSIIK